MLPAAVPNGRRQRHNQGASSALDDPRISSRRTIAMLACRRWYAAKSELLHGEDGRGRSAVLALCASSHSYARGDKPAAGNGASRDATDVRTRHCFRAYAP